MESADFSEDQTKRLLTIATKTPSIDELNLRNKHFQRAEGKLESNCSHKIAETESVSEFHSDLSYLYHTSTSHVGSAQIKES